MTWAPSGGGAGTQGGPGLCGGPPCTIPTPAPWLPQPGLHKVPTGLCWSRKPGRAGESGPSCTGGHSEPCQAPEQVPWEAALPRAQDPPQEDGRSLPGSTSSSALSGALVLVASASSSSWNRLWSLNWGSTRGATLRPACALFPRPVCPPLEVLPGHRLSRVTSNQTHQFLTRVLRVPPVPLAPAASLSLSPSGLGRSTPPSAPEPSGPPSGRTVQLVLGFLRRCPRPRSPGMRCWARRPLAAVCIARTCTRPAPGASGSWSPRWALLWLELVTGTNGGGRVVC